MDAKGNAKILFTKNDRFLATVKKRVDAYFIENQIAPHATWSIYLKTAVLFAFCLIVYSALIFGWFPLIPRLVFWLLLGIGQALFAINVGHDALHGSYSKSSKVNRLLGFLGYDLIGLSSHVWRHTHNMEHHTYTNISGADPDINKPGILRLSPHDPYYRFHAFQHIYIWFLYSLLTLDWVLFSDYAYFFKNIKKTSKKELFYFISFKSLNIFYMVIVPLMWSNMAWWVVLIGYLAAQLIAGVFVSLVFQLAHLVEGVEFPLPNKEGVLSTSWASHEMSTTANFATHSRFMCHLTGGLNFQIEHHLMPKICHVHYLDIAPIVRETAHEYSLPYHERPTLTAAIASHIRLLRQFGRGDR